MHHRLNSINMIREWSIYPLIKFSDEEREKEIARTVWNEKTIRKELNRSKQIYKGRGREREREREMKNKVAVHISHSDFQKITRVQLTLSVSHILIHVYTPLPLFQTKTKQESGTRILVDVQNVVWREWKKERTECDELHRELSELDGAERILGLSQVVGE